MIDENCINDLNGPVEFDEFAEKIVDSQVNSSLIYFISAGVSASQGYVNWNGYIEKLIEFWESHLQDLTQNRNTFYDKVEASDIAKLDWLKQQSYDNKLKVDLVHQLIKKYCHRKSDQKLDMDLYKKHVNDFESFYFLEIEPINSQNKILDELVKQSGLFITTNYDQQIEKAYNREYQMMPNIIRDASEVPNNNVLPDTTVIHLHGTPDKDNVLLVSSATSYNILYFDNPNYRTNLLKQIYNKHSPVIVFVGSSLQEQEVLHFFKDNKNNSTKYALMQYIFPDEEIGKKEAQFIKDYYENNRQIKIIWYGKDYKDLPDFLELLNNKIEEKKRERNKLIDPITLRNALEADDIAAFEELFSKALEKQDPATIDLLFKSGLDKSELDFVIANNDFIASLTNSSGYYYFWQAVNKKWRNYDITQQKKICDLIQSSRLHNNSDAILEILFKFTAGLSRSQRYKKYYQLAEKYLINYVFPDSLKNNIERCAWLIANIKYNIERDEPVYFEGKPQFKLFKISLDQLLAVLNDIYYGTEFAYLKQGIVGTLLSLIENNQLSYENGQFPADFYKNKVVQRIMINLALCNKLSQKHLDKLIKYFTFEVHDMGKETNNFVEQFIPEKYKEDTYFSDGVYTVDLPNKCQPFYKVESLNNEDDVDALIQNLERALNKKESYQYNLATQKEAIVTTLTNKEEWKKNKKQVESFILKVIDDDVLVVPYFSSVNKIIIASLKNEYLNTEEADKLISNYFQKLSGKQILVLKIENDELLTYLVNNGSGNQVEYLCKFLINDFELVQLNFYISDSEAKRKWIKPSEFVRTNAFSYCLLVRSIEQKYPQIFEKYIEPFIDKVNKLRSKERRHIKGVFYQVFKENESSDPDLATMQCFLGFSHSYYLGQKNAKTFKDAAISLLKSKINDHYCSENLTREMIMAFSPKDAKLTTNGFNKAYIIGLIKDITSTFLKRELPDENNALLWINWGLKNFAQIANSVCHFITRYIDSKQVCHLIDLIKNTNLKAKQIYLGIANFKKEKTYTLDNIDNLITLIQILDSKTLLKPSGDLTISFDSYLSEIAHFGSKKQVKKLLEITKTLVPKEVQKSFEEKYL